MRLRSTLPCLPVFAFILFTALLKAQPAGANEPLSITKIDPPNWYATLPRPMLLLRGTGFTAAHFSLSDHALSIEKATVSENGHWAQLWLSASPARPETVQVRAQRGAASTSAPFTFAAARRPGDGVNGFSARDVMYLIMTDRFADGDRSNDGPDAKSRADSAEAAAERAKPKGWHGGDLRGIRDHVGYLESLGATALWTTPVYQNRGPEAYHGYHCTDYYAVDEHYGSLDDLKQLAAALHSHGMKLVLDTVPNHVGPLHPWIKDEPTPTWFHGTEAKHLEAQYDFYSLINPHAPERDRDTTLHGWFVNLLPDMNTDDPTVALYLRQNAIWWIEETGADGLRIDTFPFVDRAFWNRFHADLHALFPRLTEVGEVSNGDPEVTSAFAGGALRGSLAPNEATAIDTGLYTPFDFPLYHAARAVFTGKEPMSRLAFILSQDNLYPHAERLVTFLGNHDESRFAGAVTDPVRRQIAWAFQMTTRGAPQIYSGDEIAMPGGDDPDNRHDFPGGFLAGPTAGVANDAFQPAQRTPEQQTTFAQIAQLAALRKSEPALACGAQQILAGDKQMLAYARFGTSGCATGTSTLARPVLVFLQYGGSSAIKVSIDDTAVAACKPGAPLVGSATAQLQDGTLTVTPQTPVVILPCTSN